jgi:hypothetical protein
MIGSPAIPSPSSPKPRSRTTSACRESAPLGDPDLQALRQAKADQPLAPEPPQDIKDLAAQFLVLVTCRDEKDQVELLAYMEASRWYLPTGQVVFKLD